MSKKKQKSKNQREVFYKNSHHEINLKNPTEQDMKWFRNERVLIWIYSFMKLILGGTVLTVIFHKLEKVKQLMPRLFD